MSPEARQRADCNAAIREAAKRNYLRLPTEAARQADETRKDDLKAFDQKSREAAEKRIALRPALISSWQPGYGSYTFRVKRAGRTVALPVVD